MDNKTLRIRGLKEANSQFPIALKSKGSSIKPKGRVRLGVARDVSIEVKLENMAMDDLVCVQYSNGFQQWMRVDDLHRTFPAAGASRTDRGEAKIEVDVWDIEPRFAPDRADRGAVKVVIEALDFFGIDLKEKAAEGLCKTFEDTKLKSVNRKEGLYACSLDDLDASSGAGQVVLTKPGSIPADQGPLLVLIHGTASNTDGAFGKLWGAGNPKGSELRASLRQKYASRVYAYEHRTLTVSPIENALGLAKALPVGAELHLVSHSRGGLIGELLCLAQRRDKSLLDEALLDRLFQQDTTPTQWFGFTKDEDDKKSKYDELKKQLLELLTELDKKNFKVTRFVRVACPARGTTLASGRLDRWLSMLSFVAGANEWLKDGADFLLGVVKERTDPRVLPGLEAQMPGSALITLLNHPDLVVDSDLSVIAGDIQGDSIWSKLKLIATDWFFSSDHDLVVNTGSMYGGARRIEGGARFYFDQGREVNHFSYFKNEATILKVESGLLRTDGTSGGFKPISEAKHEVPASRAALARAALDGDIKPVVFVLPGIMGSELALGDDLIWMSYRELARGRLERLGRDAKGVKAVQPMEDYYGKLIIHLSQSYRVEPFPYDWRLSIKSAAEELANQVKALLPWCEQHQKPMHFLAHSMGGLVVRAMIALEPDLWQRIKSLGDSRFVMLGTPNFGSYEAMRWLTGNNTAQIMLTLLDLAHGRDDIINIVRRFPGLLELLPSKGVRDFLSPALWQQLKAELDESWELAGNEDLGDARSTWRLIQDSPIDPDRMFYVAGWSPRTVCDYIVRDEVVPWDMASTHKVLHYYANRKGDGTVPWDLGRLPNVKTWYVEDAEHGQLPRHEKAFAGYVELLQKGDTKKLAASEPALSRAASDAPELFEAGMALPDSLIAGDELYRLTFGGLANLPSDSGRAHGCMGKIKLSLRHGDLAYATNPVCVGHYLGDSIVSAEKAMDNQLGGALSQRARLGLYPGQLGTQFVAINGDRGAKPGGAIVIGLGQVGELSPGRLEQSVSRAVLEYVLAVANWTDDRFGDSRSRRSVRLTMLLVGTGAGSLKIDDSLRSTLRGVALAARQLDTSAFCEKVSIDEIEILELYQDNALEAARALCRILSDAELEDQFEWPDACVKDGQGGRRRLSFNEDAQWWRRLEIAYDRKHDELRFISLTDRARAEESLVAGQLRLAEDFIAEAQKSTGNDEEVAMTLFEMLLPNRFKEVGPDQYDMVLLLDEQSARFPWEMLTNGWSMNGLPMSVAAGLLRQLKTAVYREHPAHLPANNAFVVGNPKLPAQEGDLIFPDLPGAEAEAETVAELLEKSEFEVTAKINESAREIMIGLHNDGYRILHLAGHGVHELEVTLDGVAEQKCGACDQLLPERKKKVSGMVIGNGVYLTPGDIEQMRWVPELVFINCCHLGSTLSTQQKWTRYSALAANLATQFINMGVRAVVAAGWAVDDAAAAHFAKEFYQQMMSGEGFGRAVQLARKAIYERYPGVNTWGAYQCYGDPDYRLLVKDSARTSNSKGFQTAEELVVELENLCSAIRMGRGGRHSAGGWRDDVELILRRIPPAQQEAWMARADVNTALGFLYGERANSAIDAADVIPVLKKAIDCFDLALKQETANVPVRALEKRANYQVKLALQTWLGCRGGKSTARCAEASLTEIEAAISNISQLQKLGKTVERHSLLGSAYKRQAWILAGSNKPRAASKMPKKISDQFNLALKEMAVHYQAAFKLSESNQKTEAYPLANWLAAEAILAWLGIDFPMQRDDAISACEAAKQQAQERDKANPSFWSGVVKPDCDLALNLMNLDSTTADSITSAYRAAFNRGSSPSERGSVLEHLNFLSEMASLSNQADIAAQLHRIKRELG